MKKRTIIGGMICGVICAMSVLLYTALVYKNADAARVEAMERYGGEQVEVLVATRDIYPGETLDSTNTSTKLWVSDLLPEGSVVNVRDALGKQLTSLLLAGEAVSTKRFELDEPAGIRMLAAPGNLLVGIARHDELPFRKQAQTRLLRVTEILVIVTEDVRVRPTSGNASIAVQETRADIGDFLGEHSSVPLKKPRRMRASLALFARLQPIPLVFEQAPPCVEKLEHLAQTTDGLSERLHILKEEIVLGRAEQPRTTVRGSKSILTRKNFNAKLPCRDNADFISAFFSPHCLAKPAAKSLRRKTA